MRIADSVRLANERLQPAQLSVAKGRCEDLTFNRRYFMRDGSVGWNPGKRNPNIVMPAGPSDPEVGLLYVGPTRGAEAPRKPIATYVNFAMHPDTCGGSKISADWPGALGRVLAAYHGTTTSRWWPTAPAATSTIWTSSWGWPQGTGASRHRIATILGAAIFQAYKDLKPLRRSAPLRARAEIVELALPEITPAQVEEARQTSPQPKTIGAATS